MVTNRHRDEAIEATLEMNGAAEAKSVDVFELNGPDPRSMSTFDEPEVVGVSERALQTLPEHYTFPAHSLTALEVELG